MSMTEDIRLASAINRVRGPFKTQCQNCGRYFPRGEAHLHGYGRCPSRRPTRSVSQIPRPSPPVTREKDTDHPTSNVPMKASGSGNHVPTTVPGYDLSALVPKILRSVHPSLLEREHLAAMHTAAVKLEPMALDELPEKLMLATGRRFTCKQVNSFIELFIDADLIIMSRQGDEELCQISKRIDFRRHVCIAFLTGLLAGIKRQSETPVFPEEASRDSLVLEAIGDALRDASIFSELDFEDLLALAVVKVSAPS